VGEHNERLPFYPTRLIQTMLYKFKSKAAGDVIMLQPNGQQVLHIIGNDAEPKGIIQPAQMAGAIAALNAAIAQEDSDRQAAIDLALKEGRSAPSFEAITLRQRAHPFIEMLRKCEAAGKEIVWGV
jgi:hypothetical protein